METEINNRQKDSRAISPNEYSPKMISDQVFDTMATVIVVMYCYWVFKRYADLGSRNNM